jgi:hypothetical protein
MVGQANSFVGRFEAVEQQGPNGTVAATKICQARTGAGGTPNLSARSATLEPGSALRILEESLLAGRRPHRLPVVYLTW